MSCSRGDQPGEPDRLVVEAYIDTDGFPYAILTTSISPTSRPQSAESHLVRWGKVTISDGQQSVVMTGGVDRDVFPPFRYNTFYMRGEEGKRYTITAEYEGLKATATTVLLPHPEIVGYKLQAIAGNDSLRSLSVTFRPGPAAGDDDSCFVAFEREVQPGAEFMPCFLGTIRVPADTETAELSIYRSKNNLSAVKEYISNFKLGQKVEIMLARVERTVYDFWQAYQEQTGFSHSIFVSDSQQVVGNMTGGYGCFSGRGSAIVRIDIE